MTKKILIVDDSKTQRMTLQLKLERKGYEVLAAQNGMEAIQIIYEQLPALVISDVIMPTINGYHLCRLMKRDKLIKNIPMILLTVLDKKIDRFWGIKAGADDFLSKDAPDEELYTKVETLLNNSTNNVSDISIDSSQYDFTSKVAEILDESLVKSTLINEFRDLTEFVTDEKKFNEKLFKLLTAVLDYNVLAIFCEESDKVEKAIYAAENNCNITSEAKKAIERAVLQETDEIRLNLSYKQFENISELHVNQITISDISDFKSKFIYHVYNEDKLIGIFALFNKGANKYTNLPILQTIVEELKIVLKIKWLYSQTKMLSIIDPLTELYNRRYFNQIIEKEFLRSNRYYSPLTVAMIDIDNFKKLNDNYGHQFGDEVLQVVSRLFKDCMRKTDYISRYGGEELIAVLPQTPLEQAIIPVERLRAQIENFKFIYDFKRINVTVSIGIAENDHKIKSACDLIKNADNALYEAKKCGKNRIEIAQNEE